MAITISDKKQIRPLDGALVAPIEAAYAGNFGDVVALDSNGKAVAAYAGDPTAAKARAYGMVVSASNNKVDGTFASGDTLGVCYFGRVGGFSGSTEGKEVYVSPSTAGAITETKPSGAGQQVMVVGRIEQDNILVIMPQPTAPVSGA